MMILNRIKLAVDRTIAAFSIAVMIALVVCVVWQVFSRYALNTPSTSSEEILRYGVIWMSLLGAAYASGRGSHMTVDLLRDRLTGRARLRLDGAVCRHIAKGREMGRQILLVAGEHMDGEMARRLEDGKAAGPARGRPEHQRRIE